MHDSALLSHSRSESKLHPCRGQPDHHQGDRLGNHASCAVVECQHRTRRHCDPRAKWKMPSDPARNASVPKIDETFIN